MIELAKFQRVKPILFNTDMVRDILDGRKTVTRRVIKQQEPDWEFCHMGNDPYMTRIDRNGEEYPSQETGLWATFEWEAEFPLVKAPYRPGDILYVRETWTESADGYEYRADNPNSNGWGWHPSIHMPRETVRIFLRVTDVRVERLQDITVSQAMEEGCNGEFLGTGESIGCGWEITPQDEFAGIWDSTIKFADIVLYGWDANPWVWVIAFERIGKEAVLE